MQKLFPVDDWNAKIVDKGFVSIQKSLTVNPDSVVSVFVRITHFIGTNQLMFVCPEIQIEEMVALVFNALVDAEGIQNL